MALAAAPGALDLGIADALVPGDAFAFGDDLERHGEQVKDAIQGVTVRNTLFDTNMECRRYFLTIRTIYRGKEDDYQQKRELPKVACFLYLLN